MYEYAHCSSAFDAFKYQYNKNESSVTECQKFKVIFRSGVVKEEMKFWIVNSCFCQKFKFSPPFAVTFQLHEKDFSAKLSQPVFDQIDLHLNPKSTVAWVL